ncbi:hypothetical protein ACFOGJ_19505 [Marinibaculum pumilum]|uniref:Flagellar protein FlgN n=1 Tax=Marinibaculum pumilum TaxID=1766165 RepID=A0ABV7L491_9PROT
MTAHTKDENPAAAFAGMLLDLKPMTRAARSAEPAAAPAPAEAPPVAQQRSNFSLPVNDLLSLTEDLTQAMEAETDALRSMDMDRFGELSARKIGLANNYATLLWKMQKNPDALSGLPGREKDALRQATERMKVATQDNENAVRGAHEASQILMNAIAKAAQDRRPAATTYGANGRTSAAYGADKRQGSAIFQDTRL